MMTARSSRVLRTIPLLIVVCFVSFPAQAQYSGGTGEPNDPYQIATAEDLMMLGETPEDYDKHFILTADIDLDPNLPGRKVFDKAVIAPAGYVAFTGIFDGNCHTISHLTIKGDGYLGLFGRLWSGAEIRDIGTVDASISGSEGEVGGLVGCNEFGRLTQCYSTGTVSGEGLFVGGLVGINEREGSIDNCYASVSISGTGEEVGGLVGRNGNGLVIASYAEGSVSGQSKVGGLVGSNWSTVANCSSSSQVTGDRSVGGLVGLNLGSVTKSYSTGTVNGEGLFVGGLVGINERGGSIDNCYATSIISGDQYVGGLVGSNRGSLMSCYSTGAVGGNEDVGGLVGYNWEDANVNSSFWDVETSVQPSSAGGIGKTTVEMQTASTFLDAGWDFVDKTDNGTEDIWFMPENDYPHLTWENMVWFADYMPLDPNEYGIKTFEWVYGQAGEYTSRIGESETVPYLSGPITGVQIIENNNTLVGTNDGLNVSFLASGEWILSTDPNLTAHPPAWSFAGLYDGMIIDQGVWYLVKKDMSEWEAKDKQQLLIDIQDITVPQGHYNNAVVFWYLDTAYSFTPLDFHGKEFDLDITLPSSSQAAGYAVTGFDIFAVNTGLIAQGDIDAATGSLNDLAVLKQVE